MPSRLHSLPLQRAPAHRASTAARNVGSHGLVGAGWGTADWATTAQSARLRQGGRRCRRQPPPQATSLSSSSNNDSGSAAARLQPGVPTLASAAAALSSSHDSGSSSASAPPALPAAASVKYRLAVSEDFWAVADVHCCAFYPTSAAFWDALLRMDRVLSLHVGEPRRCGDSLLSLCMRAHS